MPFYKYVQAIVGKIKNMVFVGSHLGSGVGFLGDELWSLEQDDVAVFQL